MTQRHPNILWLLGLSEENRAMVEQTAGGRFQCRILDDLEAGELHGILDQADREDPLLLWLGGDAWQSLQREDPALESMLSALPTVLVLAGNADRPLIARALQASAQQVFLEPLTPDQVQETLRRAMETYHIFSEMNRMAREVSLGRELLEHKADVCSFLFQFFIQAAETTSVCALASGCAQVLHDYCGLDGLHIAWWGRGHTVSYVLGMDSGNIDSLAWYDMLRQEARRHNPQCSDGVCVNWSGRSGAPENGKVLLLPMNIRNHCCGVLAMHMADPMPQCRDMAQALDVVRRHLAVALMEGCASDTFFQAESSYRDDAAPHTLAVSLERNWDLPVM